MTTTNIDAPVLIAGGGLVGLSAAMFLAQHGVASTVIERLRGVSTLPRAAHFHLRTLEMFRSAGIEDEVRAQSEKDFMPEGAIVALESLAGKQIAAFIPSLNEGVEALSPCRRLFITQPGLEPILRRRAESAGARVVDGLEVVGIDQNDDSVTIIARDIDSNRERRFIGRYLLGAPAATCAKRTRACIRASWRA
jgi:2-polyprenyl-6-methoxyphenol hydroxylase-like FAD-dependent oxidoreductase